MRVDGREITVTGDLLQPLTRRTNDILRLVLSTLLLAAVIASSLITRDEWTALERSVSRIVGVLTPTQSNTVYLIYGFTILALPFMILVGLVVARQWQLLLAYAAAGVISILALSITGDGLMAPRWHFDLTERLDTVVSRFVDDPRWIAMLAAVLTVSGPWLPAQWRRWWWGLLIAFVPIHLVVSAVVPARSLLGLAMGWFVGALVILISGTPALEVPLEGTVRALQRRGFVATGLTVLQPAGRGPMLLTASSEDGSAIVELYGPHQRSGGVLRQFWRKLRLRDDETGPLQTSLRRVVEHRALMTIAVGELGLANTTPISLSTLDRGWTIYAHEPARGVPLVECADLVPVERVWESLGVLHGEQMSHGDLRRTLMTADDGKVLFGSFEYAEYGATDAHLHTDIAQLLVTTSDLYGTEAAVGAAIDEFGADAVLAASRRLTKAGVPGRVRAGLAEAGKLLATAREEVKKQTGADQIKTANITRFNRNQIIQLVLLGALVYVAYPFISTVPAFFSQLAQANYWWALVGVAVSALKYVGAATALWACANGAVKFGHLVVMQVANTLAATTTPAGLGGLALSTRFLQKGGLGAMRATAAVTLQQSVQVITHIVLLIIFSAAIGVSADLSRFIPNRTAVLVVVGVIVVVLAVVLALPMTRRWLNTSARPRIKEVLDDLVLLAREPKRLALIVLGCATTTLGGALALWASIAAFGGDVSFVTITIVTMVGQSLASAAPTPGGVGAVEAALIGGLAAFGVPTAVAVPSTLLYRILTCWLPVFMGWPIMRWLGSKDLI